MMEGVIRSEAAPHIILPIRVVKQIKLVVAPGQPDDPQRAEKFLLSWWERDPPKSAGTWGVNVNGWCFFVKKLGIEGRELVEKHGEEYDPAPLWTAMFGPAYAVRVWREGDGDETHG